MADEIKVDTARVAATARNMANLNKRIRDDFSEVESAMKALNSAWDGSAAAHGMDAFHGLKNAYDQPRYDVMNNYVEFLQQQVDPGYTKTENTNVRLADRFK